MSYYTLPHVARVIFHVAVVQLIANVFVLLLASILHMMHVLNCTAFWHGLLLSKFLSFIY